MLEEQSSLTGDPVQIKGVLHDKEHIDVIRFGLGGNERPKDEETIHRTCRSRQFVDPRQACSDGLALRRTERQMPDKLANRSPMYARGQIASLSERR